MAGVRRETLKDFWSRVEREGRRAEAEAYRDDLLEYGYTKREAQEELVGEFQPTDGSRTRAWWTPDSWACGRLDAKKPPPDSQEQLERDAMWVHKNRDRPLAEAPTAGARLLLEMAQKRPGEFFKVYHRCLPGIVRRQQEQLEARRDRVYEKRERAEAIAQEEARKQAQAKKRAEEEARRNAEAQKQEQERLQREQAAKGQVVAR